jgi:hypothetical protein
MMIFSPALAKHDEPYDSDTVIQLPPTRHLKHIPRPLY